MVFSDVVSGIFPSSINVYVSSADLDKDIYASQKVDFALP